MFSSLKKYSPLRHHTKPFSVIRGVISLKSSPDRTLVIIPQGTQIAAEAPPPPASTVAAPMLLPKDEDPIIFETDEPLVALGAELKVVQVFDGANYVNYSAANAVAGEHYPVFGRRARKGSTLMLGFASNQAFPTSEINLAVRIYTDPANLKPHSCPLPDAKTPPPATISWEYWNGSRWRLLSLLNDETWALTRSGHIYFQGPKGMVKDRFGVAQDEQLYWLRCRLIRTQYELPPELEAVLTSPVKVA